MNIIEKQGAVTRLITAIQNRMLKETWFTSHICKDCQVSMKVDCLKGLPFGYPPSLYRDLFQKSLEFFGDFPLLMLTCCQELRAAVLKAEQVQLQPNEYPARDLNWQHIFSDSVELMDHGGNFRT